jgi:CRP-like cAMP-binding protein
MAALIRKLQNFVTLNQEEQKALQKTISVRKTVKRGEDIIVAGSSPKYSTVLLEGLACRYKIIENGRRQILSFRYPGDFCDSHSYILAELDYTVGALSQCTVGLISHKDITCITKQFPNIALALWRDSIAEASVFCEWLVNVGQRPALDRIAHLLCEQMARLEAIDIHSDVLPMTQVDLADATGLSAVHMNRSFRELKKLGAVSSQSRPIVVSQRKRLMDIAKFDGRYLHMPKIDAKWNYKAMLIGSVGLWLQICCLTLNS